VRRLPLVAAALALGLAGGVAASALPRERPRQITVTAYFTRTIGLFPQSPVRVLGVTVGRVVEVRPVGEKVRVVMRIDARRKIPADARAFIVPISLISDRYVQLAPVWRGGETLADGAVIDVDRTAVPAELDDLLAQLKKFLDALVAETPAGAGSLGEAVRNLSRALAGAGDDLSTVLGAGAPLAAEVAAHAGAIDDSVAHLARLVEALARRRDDIAALSAGLAEALGAVAAERRALEGALAGVADLTEALGSLVRDHRAALEEDLRVLAATTREVVAHQDSLLRALAWLPVLADAAEAGHAGGAVHVPAGGGPAHVDVRDAHLFSCPGLPQPLCLVLGLTGNLVVPGPGPAAAPGTAAPGAPAVGSPPTGGGAAGPSAPDPLDLLDRLPRIALAEREAAGPGPVRSLFERLAGALDRAWRWLR
jgi:phospholipid/cholesterol/gamma-HCH transport system substrate-binding protein